MALDNLSWERRDDFPVEDAAAGTVNEKMDTVKPPELAPRQDTSSSLRGLPSLMLPKFSGSAAEWPRWQALFKSLVHDKRGLSQAEKMIYLQSSVTGQAECDWKDDVQRRAVPATIEVPGGQIW